MLAPWLLAPHLHAIFQAYQPDALARRWPRWRAGVVSGFLVCVAVGLVLLSPAARWAVGRPLLAEERVGPMAPYHLAAGLAERGPEAASRRVFSLPYWWGDYLLWQLPRGDQVFWYSRPEGFMHRGDPLGLDPSASEWRALVERHGFDTLVVRADSSAGLLAYLAETTPGEWVVVGDNCDAHSPGGGPASRGVVVVRRGQ
jgi:hypothetical protein